MMQSHYSGIGRPLELCYEHVTSRYWTKVQYAGRDSTRQIAQVLRQRLEAAQRVRASARVAEKSAGLIAAATRRNCSNVIPS